MEKINEQEILNNPTISYWLKEQIIISEKRDVLDAINDAELLLKILNERFEALANQRAVVSHITNDPEANASLDLYAQKQKLPVKPKLPSWTNGLPVRVANCLVNAGFQSIKEVRAQHRKCYDFLTIPIFGRRCLPELQTWLDDIPQRGENKLKELFK